MGGDIQHFCEDYGAVALKAHFGADLIGDVASAAALFGSEAQTQIGRADIFPVIHKPIGEKGLLGGGADAEAADHCAGLGGGGDVVQGGAAFAVGLAGGKEGIHIALIRSDQKGGGGGNAGAGQSGKAFFYAVQIEQIVCKGYGAHDAKRRYKAEKHNGERAGEAQGDERGADGADKKRYRIGQGAGGKVAFALVIVGALIKGAGIIVHALFAAEIMQIAVGADIVPAAELGIGKGFAQVGGKIFYMVLQLAGLLFGKEEAAGAHLSENEAAAAHGGEPGADGVKVPAPQAKAAVQLFFQLKCTSFPDSLLMER